jgi:hypothetical protein
MATAIYGSDGKRASKNTPGWKRVQQEMAVEADTFDLMLHARAHLIASDDAPPAWNDRTPYTWEIVRLLEIMTEVCGLTPKKAAIDLLRAIDDQGR